MTIQIKRGDIFWVNFGLSKGSEQGGVRPAVVVQNDVGNKFAPTVIVAPITSEIKKKELPTHVVLRDFEKYGLKSESQVLTEQMKVVDKKSVGDYIGSLDDEIMIKVDKAIEISVSVGSAKLIESREIKVIKEKVEEIRDLDKFIQMWLSKNNDIDRIQSYLKDREIAIKDLERYATINNMDFREYYSPVVNKRVRLVG